MTGRLARTPNSRTRRAPGPVFLARGFRPFFLAAGLWAAVALPLSVVVFEGWMVLPTGFDPIAWHVHEMLFGYAAAAIAGFLLTAIPNWTGHLPIRGGPLLGLAALWLAGRIAMTAGGPLGPWAVAALDLAFPTCLCAAASREILAGRNWRNLPVVTAVALLVVADAVTHAEAGGFLGTVGLGARGGIATVIALITLIGGRVVPSFTRNWLVKRGAAALPAPFDGIDRAAIALTVATLAAWTAAPDSAWTGAAALLAAAANLLRLARWRGHATLADPLVWVLHLGYLWIPVGLGLIGLSLWWPALPQSGAVHALTAGAVGTMTLAVMSRATLGHTGRALRAGPWLTAAYLLVAAAASCRIASSVWDGAHWALLHVAAGAWVLAFALFVAVCGPMMVRRRRDGAPE